MVLSKEGSESRMSGRGRNYRSSSEDVMSVMRPE